MTAAGLATVWCVGIVAALLLATQIVAAIRDIGIARHTKEDPRRPRIRDRHTADTVRSPEHPHGPGHGP